MVPLQLKDYLELITMRKEFHLPGTRFLSHRDMNLSVERDVKTFSSHPSFTFTPKVIWYI